MRVCLLGPVKVLDGATEVPVGGLQQRRLLARLALGAGTPVSLEALEFAAWGDDPPPTARHTIASRVFRLRAIGLDIETVTEGYRLGSATDVEELQRFAANGRAIAASDREHATRLLREGLALVRGQPFPELDDVPAATIEAARLGELIEELREDLLAAELDSGQAAELIPGARRLAAEQPYRERRWELLMLALYRAGRQAESLGAYAECRRLLVDDLGLEPGPGLRRMQQAVLAQDPSLEPPAVAPAATGPTRPRVPGTSTRLIGRLLEQEDLAQVWDRARLATIVGPPGSGKTRLALEAARTATISVWYVTLEQLSTDQSVAAAILDVVAPSSRATDASRGVRDALVDATGLLVLDGCERRLREVASEVEALLSGCPTIRILATSRERLGVFDEALIPVGPLPPNEALELLVDRARLLDPQFRLAPSEVETADRLCALVDCLPLGLELVARHLHVLRVDEVARRVESDLGRWAGGPVAGRAGLWAALDASVSGLTSREREVLVALAVMVADADTQLVGEVAAIDDPATDDPAIDVFEIVARLVDASLVQVRSALGPTRYELLRIVAGFTLETTEEHAVAAARMRYGNAVLRRARSLAEQVATAERATTLQLLDREMPHVRAVLGSVHATPVDRDQATRALELAVLLNDYWLGRHPAEGLDWLGRLIEAADPEPALRAEALLSGGHLAYWLADFDRGRLLVEESRELFAALGDALGEGRALRRLGAIAAATDDVSGSRRYLEASLVRLDIPGLEKETGTTLLHLGSLLADEGDVEAARPVLERALTIANAGDDPLAVGHVLAALTLARWKAGDLDGAAAVGEEALTVFRGLGHRPTEGTVAYRMAAVTPADGRPRAARRYAELAIEAGEQVKTRTTVAFGYLNLARLDLDTDDYAAAAGHLVRAADLLDPVADRWVLAEELEAVARLVTGSGRVGAAELLAAADAIREDIGQPVAPTEAADVESVRARSRSVSTATQPTAPPLDAVAAHAMATRFARELARLAGQPSALRSARRQR